MDVGGFHRIVDLVHTSWMPSQLHGFSVSEIRLQSYLSRGYRPATYKKASNLDLEKFQVFEFFAGMYLRGGRTRWSCLLFVSVLLADCCVFAVDSEVNSPSNARVRNRLITKGHGGIFSSQKWIFLHTDECNWKGWVQATFFIFRLQS